MPYDPKIDYYELIGDITPSSNLKQIKRSYRKKALKYHTDKNPGKEEWAKNKFLELKYIYEILIDKEKKERYDIDREKYLSFKNPTSYEVRPDWKYTTNLNINSLDINLNSINFVKRKPYVVHDYGKDSNQIFIRVFIYSVMFIMVLVTIYMLIYINQ